MRTIKTQSWRKPPSRTMMLRPFVKIILLVAVASAIPVARAQSGLQVVTDRANYNVGSDVLVRPANSGEIGSGLMGIISYAGDPKPLAEVPLRFSDSSGYTKIWHIPNNAKTGRYGITILAGGETSPLRVPVAFTVYRKLVTIEEIHLDKTFYTSGDPVAVTAKIRNLTQQPLTGLRVEFSDRYWPWIAGPAAQAQASVVPLATAVDLKPGAERTFQSSHAAVAIEVKQPAVHQYGVVVWDHSRQTVLAIAFSPLALIHPPGVEKPQAYPSQYMYPHLDQVNVTAYRQFYPPSLDSAAIRFDHSHTLYPVSSRAEVKFTVQNPTAASWQDATVRARLLGPKGSAIEEQTVARSLNLARGAPGVEKTVSFELPPEAGLYQAEVEIRDSAGSILAANRLDLGANPLPKSILLFSAHEDDEGGWMGLIRAAVENHVPIHFVYFTSGDAGSCDLYYEQSCDPEQATHFGSIRMDEVRAALGHLGVPPADVYFLGLPDGASGMIWYGHRNPSTPFLDPLLGTDHAPYGDLVRPNLPYDRESVVETVEQLIRKFNPEVIVTAHPPAEGHIDHVVNNYFVVKALEQLRSQGAVPASLELRVDRVYNPKEIPPTPYHYAEHTFYVSGEAEALAQEAGWYHQSQGGNRAIGRLRDFDQLPRSVPYREIVDWSEHAGWNDKQ